MCREDLPRILRRARIHHLGRVTKNLPPVVAIDGPSASGKGTVAREVARALGFHFLDSGALYRLVALAALDRGLDLADAPALAEVGRNLNAVFDGDSVALDG